MAEPTSFLFLSQDPTIAALIGDRIYPDRLPQQHPNDRAVMPAVVFQLAGAEYQALFCQTDELVGGSYQIDIYATKRDDIPPVASAIAAFLKDYAGPMGESRVSRVLLQNQFGSVDPDPGLFRRTQLYTIWFAET